MPLCPPSSWLMAERRADRVRRSLEIAALTHDQVGKAFPNFRAWRLLHESLHSVEVVVLGWVQLPDQSRPRDNLDAAHVTPQISHDAMFTWQVGVIIHQPASHHV